jgi:SAM-dependent methyltransferase
MPSVTPERGSATRWGPLWGSRAQDWAVNEDQQVPTYEAVIERVGIGPGHLVLDIGCGAGTFLRLAAGRGAQVFGLDASEALVDLARTRLGHADLRVGEMEALPFEDDTFDLVTGFNAFFFAADMVAALREARRVAKPGARVVVQVWGAPDRCALEAMKAVVRPFLPTPPAGAAKPPELWRPGVLEAIAAQAGLVPESAFEVRWPYVYPDDDTLGRAMLAPAGLAELIGPAQEAEVTRQIAGVLAPYRHDAGGYRLENEFHILITRA